MWDDVKISDKLGKEEGNYFDDLIVEKIIIIPVYEFHKDCSGVLSFRTSV